MRTTYTVRAHFRGNSYQYIQCATQFEALGRASMLSQQGELRIGSKRQRYKRITLVTVTTQDGRRQTQERELYARIWEGRRTKLVWVGN